MELGFTRKHAACRYRGPAFFRLLQYYACAMRVTVHLSINSVAVLVHFISMALRTVALNFTQFPPPPLIAVLITYIYLR